MALLESEIIRLRFECGYNLLNAGAEPYVSVVAIFNQVIATYMQAGATTTSSTSAGSPTPSADIRESRLPGALADEELHEALELCLGCKACATQCPVKVDVPSFRQRQAGQVGQLGRPQDLDAFRLHLAARQGQGVLFPARPRDQSGLFRPEHPQDHGQRGPVDRTFKVNCRSFHSNLICRLKF